MEKLVKEQLELTSIKPFGGGGGGCVCVGQGYNTNIGEIYVKYCENKSKRDSSVIFNGEFASLQALYDTGTVRVPKPIRVCEGDKSVCLVTEYVHMNSLRKNRELGQKLADLHNHNANQKQNSSVHKKGVYVDKFGFDVVTCCGIIEQPNEWNSSWVQFFTEQKLKYQVDMILSKKGDRELNELWPRLVRAIPSVVEDKDILPALVHGDLWSGNASQVDNEPCIFDPASFYAHGEFDLAIATMFGGFGGSFTDGYFEKRPRTTGFDRRNRLYQLFHYLNHWNHFGGGYRSQSIAIMREFAG